MALTMFGIVARASPSVAVELDRWNLGAPASRLGALLVGSQPEPLVGNSDRSVVKPEERLTVRAHREAGDGPGD